MMTRNYRRNILKRMAVGFPAAWSPPIVTSVVLPAHAQTSTDCDLPLVIDDVRASCSGSDSKEHYYIDDTGRCPEVVSLETGSTPDDAEMITFEILGEGSQIAIRLVTGGTSEATGTFRRAEIQNCGDDQNPPFEPDINSEGPLTITARSGADYSLFFQRVRNEESVAFTDIGLVPA